MSTKKDGSILRKYGRHAVNLCKIVKKMERHL